MWGVSSVVAIATSDSQSVIAPYRYNAPVRLSRFEAEAIRSKRSSRSARFPHSRQSPNGGECERVQRTAQPAIRHIRVWFTVSAAIVLIDGDGGLHPARCVEQDQNQISTTNRTHARTGPDTQRAQAHNHTQNSNSRTQRRRVFSTSSMRVCEEHRFILNFIQEAAALAPFSGPPPGYLPGTIWATHWLVWATMYNSGLDPPA